MIALASTRRDLNPVSPRTRRKHRRIGFTRWTLKLRHALGLFTTSVVLSAPGWLWAQPNVELACGSHADFLEQLDREYSLASEAIPLSTIRIWKHPEGGYALLVQGPEGSRQLRHQSCSTLRRTALVMAATSGVASARSTADADSSEAAPAAESNSESPFTRVTQSELDATRVSDPQHATHAVGFGISAGAELGLAPAPAAVLEVHGALRWHRFGARLLGRYYSSQSAENLTPEGYGLRWSAWGTRFSGFFQPFPWLRADVGLRLDLLQARGLQMRTPNSDQIWLPSPELELAWIPVSWASWALELGLRGRVGLRQPRFALEPDRAVIHQVPRWGAAALFRLSWENR